MKVAVFGAAGRMGQEVIAVIKDDPKVNLAAAIERDGHELLGEKTGCDDTHYRSVKAAAVKSCDVVIAFPDATGATEATRLALKSKKPLVLGATGLGDSQKKELKSAAKEIAVLVEPNMSVGINMLCKMAGDMAARLKGWDAEVFEIHHRGKVDAPSGTAMRLHDVLVKARGGKDEFSADRVSRRTARPDDEIGHAVLRAGDVVGEHTVYLVGQGERIELTHRATSRRNFAAGAVFAAKKIADKPPGQYRLEDLLEDS